MWDTWSISLARIRTIKPEFGQHDKLSALPAETHLFAALLLPFADDEGYFPANPRLVHAALCPLRELLQSVPHILQSLHGIGYVELFIGTDGREYGHIGSFLDHQRVSHPSPSKIKPLRKIPEPSVNPPEPLRPELKGNGIEVEVEAIPEQQPPSNCARRLMEILNLAQTAGFLKTIEAAVIAEAGYLGMSPADAAQQIATHAMEHRRKGLALDKWYFEETKWRNGNGKQQASAVEQRVSGNREVLAETARAIIAQRTRSDGDELKDSTGAAAKRGVRASAG